MSVALGDLLQLVNLILIPILVYVVRFERRFAILETTREEVYRRLDKIDGDVQAVHRRMDHANVPAVSSRST